MSVLSRFRFPLLFGCFLIACEITLALILWKSAPAETRWLGDTIQNSSDAAVYLSYIKQGSDGSVFLRNRYAAEPHMPRFDLVWSTLGFVSRTGIPPVLVHEGARWIFTGLLVLSIFTAARSVFATQRETRIATVLAFGGVSTGWVYSIWLGTQNLWSPESYASPDAVTELAIAPILLGGAHMILSLALLVASVRLIWQSFRTPSFRSAGLGTLCAGILFLFHPYFIPLIGVLVLIGAMTHRTLPWRNLLALGSIFAASLIPAAIVYMPLAFDSVFRTHHLDVNILPLAPGLAWIVALLPFAPALVWRWQKCIGVSMHERWIVAWIAAAIICMLLPIPWKRKYTEGLNVALVFLTLPAWLALWDWLRKDARGIRMRLTAFALLLAAWLTPLHLFASQLFWISQPQRQSWFYRPSTVFEAWTFLHDTAPTSSIIIADDRWINIWTPTYANRTVWVAHDHETPDFQRKRESWRRLFGTDDAREAHDILARSGVTHIMTTTQTSTRRLQTLLGEDWLLTFRAGDIAIFARRPHY